MRLDFGKDRTFIVPAIAVRQVVQVPALGWYGPSPSNLGLRPPHPDPLLRGEGTAKAHPNLLDEPTSIPPLVMPSPLRRFLLLVGEWFEMSEDQNHKFMERAVRGGAGGRGSNGSRRRRWCRQTQIGFHMALAFFQNTILCPRFSFAK